MSNSNEGRECQSHKDKERLQGKPPLYVPLQIRCHFSVNHVIILIILKMITGFEL